VIHKKPAPVGLQQSPNIKSASPAPCSTAQTSTSKSRAWTTKNSAAPKSEKRAHQFVNGYKLQEIFRISDSADVVCNADMRAGEVRLFCSLQPEGVALSLSKCQSLMRAAMSQLNLSARAYHRILKLSRTIADLAGSEEIESAHLAEALQYRPKIMLG
jgi:predicted ATPase with chaperone activity